ncbi:MAG: radical SAM protein [Candidatus Heimdallarchaeota archaeon]|nr:MAG: radical SAM protein [Candidatus Heimdallarchaeota archaeon]
MLRDFEGYFLNEEMKTYFEAFKLYTLQLEINQICQQNCTYCYARESRGEEMDPVFVRSILDDAAKMEVRKIEWLGGDCLLHSSWEELMAYARYEYGLINNIWTSGNQLKKRSVAKKAIELTADGGFISVHLDSVNPEVYRKLNHGNIRFLEDSLEGLQNLINLGKPPSEIINCMALTGLQAGEDFKNTVEYFHEKFRIPVTFVSYKPTSKDPRLEISPQQIKEAERIKTNICLGPNVPIIPQCVSKFYCGTTASVILEADKSTVGNLTICSRIRYSFGKIASGQSFRTQFDKHKHILLTRKLKHVSNLPTDCQSCSVNDICWGCRSNAWYYTGDVFAGDPRCWRRSTNALA